MNTTLTHKAQQFLSVLPHCQVLGFTVPEVNDQCLIMAMPYQPKAIGNPLTSVLHSGSMTTLMDTACGTAAHTFLPGSELCPTLDLRIDHFQAADPEAALYAEAEVVRITSSVVFTRCQVFQHKADHPDRRIVATCTSTFMRLPPETVRGHSIAQAVSAQKLRQQGDQ